jgi:hypothetical protein
MPDMIEYCKIRSVLIPVYSEAKDEEDKIVSWKELTVAYVTVLPEQDNDFTGINIEMQDNICLVCFDKKADTKVLYKLFVGTTEFKIGRYEVNEFRRGYQTHKKRNKTGWTGDSPGQRNGDKKQQ